MKFINLIILSMVVAVPVPEKSSKSSPSHNHKGAKKTASHNHKGAKKCDGPGSFTQQIGALLAFQDPRKACGHDHGKAHFGLQTPEQAYTDTPVGQGFGFNFFNPLIEGTGKLLGLNE